MTTSDFLDLKLARLSAFVGAGKGLRAAAYSALAQVKDFVLIESIDFNDAHLQLRRAGGRKCGCHKPTSIVRGDYYFNLNGMRQRSRRAGRSGG
jgi:hypothetical protein